MKGHNMTKRIMVRLDDLTDEDIKKALKQYRSQKSKSKKRNIGFHLTFDEWLDWWLNTGHYHDRGRGKEKYVMCRYGDMGDYSLDNIYCDKSCNNISTAMIGNKHVLGKRYSPEVNKSKGSPGASNCKAVRVKVLGKVYGCITHAAKANNVSSYILIKRLKKQLPGYEYL